MALRLDEFLYFSPQERRVAEKLPFDSPERKSMREKKLAEVRASSQHTEERKEKPQ